MAKRQMEGGISGGGSKRKLGSRGLLGLSLLIPVVIVCMFLALASVERRADTQREELDAASEIDAALHDVQRSSEAFLQSDGRDVAARARIDLRFSDATGALDELDRLEPSVPLIEPIRTAVDGYGRQLRETLTIHSHGLRAAALREFRWRVDLMLASAQDTLQRVMDHIRNEAEAAETLRGTGTFVTLSVGGLLLLVLSLRAARVRRRDERLNARASGIAESEERFQSLMAGSSDLVTVLDEHGRITFQSASIQRVLGWTDADVVGKDVRDLMHPDDARAVGGLLEKAQEMTGARQTADWRMRKADGEVVPMEAILVGEFANPRIGGVLVNLRDLSERLRLEEALRHRAFHDPLTGLANRVLFEDRLEHALDRTIRSGAQACVLLLDLDFFKDINDSYGHAVGDQVLVEAAQRIKLVTRPEDTVARLGGDEFGILMEEIEQEDEGARVAERLLATLGERPISLDGTDVFLRASIGIVSASSIGSRRQEGHQQVLIEADLAMYEAKRQGRGRFQYFAPEMQEALRKRMELKSDLERALVRGEFLLHYQPIVMIESGAIVGVEALVRWQHPVRGLVPPMEFIPMAEQTGLIVELGRWVLNEACHEATRWTVPPGGESAPYVTVNVAGFQLQQPSFVREVRDALDSAELEPGRLVIEVTESALIEDTEGNELKLQELNDLGVRLAIDDFGTGYSSLNYLRRFNMDILKIDKSFVDGLGSDTSDTKESTLVAAMVAMGLSLHMSVVAEGVEENRQLEDLRLLHCQFGQGYLFARPVPAAALELMLDSQDEPVATGAAG
jgi:diguanylate cyclase (GGDEF)-like protein/PAS domain S-box-containing protein